jgi:hypothetical protein
VNVGVFIAAALLLDLLLWVFVLLGWESVSIPADFADTHQAVFTFPYSHGLLASLFWPALAGVFVCFIYSSVEGKWRVAALVAAAVLSHWALDMIVHRPELPLPGSSLTFGWCRLVEPHARGAQPGGCDRHRWMGFGYSFPALL